MKALLIVLLCATPVWAQDAKKEQENALLLRVQQLEKQLAAANETMKDIKATPVVTVTDGRAVVSCVITK